MSLDSTVDYCTHSQSQETALKLIIQAGQDNSGSSVRIVTHALCCVVKSKGCAHGMMSNEFVTYRQRSTIAESATFADTVCCTGAVNGS